MFVKRSSHVLGLGCGCANELKPARAEVLEILERNQPVGTHWIDSAVGNRWPTLGRAEVCAVLNNAAGRGTPGTLQVADGGVGLISSLSIR